MTTRMPTVYLPHGGGPWPFVDLGQPAQEVDSLRDYLSTLGTRLPQEPNALLVVSAHWEARKPTVMTNASPPMLYDYYGFPEASYRLRWPAPGAPELAERVQALLAEAGIDSDSDAQRGFDHGAFIPLMLTYPDAKIPTVQLSLQKGLSPSAHLEIGRALAPLRDAGVLIVGSGMSFHNMPAFRMGRAMPDGTRFDAWLHEAIGAAPAERDAALADWTSAPGARGAHPREEHLLPLMVIAGAAGADQGKVDFKGAFMRQPITAAWFG